MLELKNVKKSFDGTPVLKDISLAIADGEIVSILGPSGCGKTTLLNLILGILDADEGQILFNGEDMTRVPMETGDRIEIRRAELDTLILKIHHSSFLEILSRKMSNR